MTALEIDIGLGGGQIVSMILKSGLHSTVVLTICPRRRVQARSATSAISTGATWSKIMHPT